MTFYEKYLELCASVDKTPSGAALEMGLSKPTVNRWKNGGGITDATARKVAAYFGVPTDYLTGQTDDPHPAEQKEKPTVTDDDGLSIQWADVEAAFKAAPPELREAAKAAALAVLKSQGK